MEIGESASKLLANYSVGLIRISDGSLRPICSAILVTLGSLRGLITAAHVLQVLPKTGQVGVLLYLDDESIKQSRKINMDYCVPLLLGGDAHEDPQALDIGFLRISDVEVGALAGRASFLNLATQRTIAQQAMVGTSSIHGVLGVVDEWTTPNETSQEHTVRNGLNALFAAGSAGSAIQLDNRDVFEFQVDAEFRARDDGHSGYPASFGGVSGGGVWRVTPSEAGGLGVPHLIGVAFHQRSGTLIMCQGPRTLYNVLIPAMASKWPEEVGDMREQVADEG